MPGVPGKSVLAPFEAEIRELMAAGTSLRGIAQILNERHDLRVSHNAVYSFVRAKRRRSRFRRSFLDGLDKDLQHSLMQQLVAGWTHDSTAIEGNTLTLGETLEVLEHGLTISGKPLKDHEEVYGHARAIELLQKLTHADVIKEAHIFDLHRAIMPHVPVDSRNPVGDWKRDFNGTTGIADGKTVYMEYSSPSDTPVLMQEWLKGFNHRLDPGRAQAAALDAYLWSHMTFVRIHPFFDGNGRLARLLANLPVLRSGMPPLTVAAEARSEYIKLLWNYQWEVGLLKPNVQMLPEHPTLPPLREFFLTQWTRVLDMVKDVRNRQHERDGQQ